MGPWPLASLPDFRTFRFETRELGDRRPSVGTVLVTVVTLQAAVRMHKVFVWALDSGRLGSSEAPRAPLVAESWHPCHHMHMHHLHAAETEMTCRNVGALASHLSVLSAAVYRPPVSHWLPAAQLHSVTCSLRSSLGRTAKGQIMS